MNTASNEYNIFMLDSKRINRLEIGASTSMWHDINSNILYGEYTRRACRTFGDYILGQLYKDTLKNAKAIEADIQTNTKWDGGVFYKETVKYLSDDEYYSYTEKSGRFHSELCRYGGVTIEVYIYDEACDLDLTPFNCREYKMVKRQKEMPLRRDKPDDYDNYIYLAELFKGLFLNLAKTSIDLSSDEALSQLLYKEMNMPVVVKGKNGLGSVKAKALRALAGVKKETPSSIFRNDIKDKNGRIVLKANVMNQAEYPAAVYLQKHRYYAEQAEGFKSRGKT